MVVYVESVRKQRACEKRRLMAPGSLASSALSRRKALEQIQYLSSCENIGGEGKDDSCDKGQDYPGPLYCFHI